ncbi:MAG: flavodoxin domain-containing protein [Flavobacteriaceae bacterium]
MKAAIFFSGKYGSTEQYAKWIGEATGLPVFDIKDKNANPAAYDFLILGSSVLYYKLSIRKWAKENLPILKDRSKMLFSVSGAGPSDKLERWVADSLPPELLANTEHFALRGKLDHSKLSWLLRKILYVASLMNSDPEASKDERYGFDYMDKTSIQPILSKFDQFQRSETTG